MIMVIRDENGKIIGSIEFSDKELDLDNEKFIKMIELGTTVIESDKELKINKNNNFHNTMNNVVNSVRNFGLEYYATDEKMLFHKSSEWIEL